MWIEYKTEIIVTLTLIMISYLLLTYVIRPYRQLKAFAKILKANYSTYEYPFGLMGFPLIKRFQSDLDQFGDALQTKKYILPNYQVVLASYANKLHISFVDPQLLKQFYEKSAQGCYERYEGRIFRDLKNFANAGLVLTDGEQWKIRKKILSQVFNHEFIKSKIKDIIRISKDIIKTQSEKHQREGVVHMNLMNLFQKIFGSVVLHAFLGNIELELINGKSPFQLINSLIHDFGNRSFSMVSALLGPKFFKLGLRQIDRNIQKNSKIFRNYAKNIIEKQVQILEKENNNQVQHYGGIIQLLIKQGKLKQSCTQQERLSQGLYSYQGLIDEMALFFIVGIDATSSSTLYFIYELVKNPLYLEKVRNEIKNVIGDDLGKITYEKLKQMKQLDNSLKETLRMFTPTPNIMLRKVTKDHYIGKIPMKIGYLASIQLIGNHYKQSYYSDPYKFNPDRWSKAESNPNPFSYLPFSFGQRSCIGQNLSAIETKIAIITLLVSFKDIKLEKENYKLILQSVSCPQEMITRLVRA